MSSVADVAGIGPLAALACSRADGGLPAIKERLGGGRPCDDGAASADACGLLAGYIWVYAHTGEGGSTVGSSLEIPVVVLACSRQSVSEGEAAQGGRRRSGLVA